MRYIQTIAFSLCLCLFLSACQNNTTPTPNPLPPVPANPCKVISAKITNGISNNSIPLLYYTDGNGTDTLQIDYEGFNQFGSDRYKVFSYDGDSLTVGIHTYDAQDHSPMKSREIAWYERGYIKELKEFDHEGGIRFHNTFDDKGNFLTQKIYRFGSLSESKSFRYSYAQNNLLLSAVELDIINNDTTKVETYNYTPSGLLGSRETDYINSFRDDFITGYSYDAQDRLIEKIDHLLPNLEQQQKFEYEYLNGLAEVKTTFYRETNDPLTIFITKTDSHGNVLSKHYYDPATNDLRYKIEYEYLCQ